MMQEEGELAKIGKTTELFDVIGKYGDKAADFVWKNKGALAVGATLTAFLADPKPFIEGTVALAGTTTKAAGDVAKEAARQVNWTLVALAVVAVVEGEGDESLLGALLGVGSRHLLFDRGE